jgi:hypothetical protein
MEIQSNQNKAVIPADNEGDEHQESKSQNASSKNMPKLNSKLGEKSELEAIDQKKDSGQISKSDQEADEESTSYGHSIEDSKNQTQSQES